MNKTNWLLLCVVFAAVLFYFNVSSMFPKQGEVVVNFDSDHLSQMDGESIEKILLSIHVIPRDAVEVSRKDRERLWALLMQISEVMRLEDVENFHVSSNADIWRIAENNFPGLELSQSMDKIGGEEIVNMKKFANSFLRVEMP